MANMKQVAEILDALDHCSKQNGMGCTGCPYRYDSTCISSVAAEAAKLIREMTEAEDGE